MLTSFTLALVATLAPMQAPEIRVPDEIQKEMAFLEGNWKGTTTTDGEKEPVTYSAKWNPGRDSLLLTYSTPSLKGTGLGGWDPTAKEIVEVWHSPTAGRLTLRYTVKSDTVWEGTSRAQDPDGEVTEGTIRRVKTSDDRFVVTHKLGDNSIEIVYERVLVPPPPTNAERIAPMKFLIGKWKGVADSGNTIHWEFEWGTNKNFIENELVIRNSDGELQFSNNGLLGWDNGVRRIVNWCMNSNGVRMNFAWEQRDKKNWDTWIIGQNATWKLRIEDDDTFVLDTGTDAVTYKRQD
jgi:hypothetical protein